MECILTNREISQVSEGTIYDKLINLQRERSMILTRSPDMSEELIACAIRPINNKRLIEVEHWIAALSWVVLL
jgi:hypothetical protein